MVRARHYDNRNLRRKVRCVMETYVFNIYVRNHHGSTERRWYRVRTDKRGLAGHIASAQRNAAADGRTDHITVTRQDGLRFIEVARIEGKAAA